MIQGPDRDAPAIDHEARITLVEHEYQTTGTLSTESTEYLLWQARMAIKLDKYGQDLYKSSEAYTSELLNVIQSLNSQILALKEQLDSQ